MRASGSWLVALLVGILVVPSAAAQSCRFAGQTGLEGQFAFELQGGVTVPLGQLGDEVSLDARPVDTGLDFHRGWDGRVGGEFFVCSFLSLGLSLGQNGLDMRDQLLASGGGAPVPYARLVRGKTTVIGLRAKGYLPMPGPWSPYAEFGLTHSHRQADISHALAPSDPSNPIYSITDDCVGFDLGTGFEYRVARHVGLGVGATYSHSGPFAHDFPWMGHGTIVHDWDSWALDARLTVHLPGMQAH